MNALLFNAPDSLAGLSEYSAIHQADHFQITAQLFEKVGVTINQPPLDPIPFQFDLLTWLMNHQFVHNEVNGYLNLPGFDLTGVDFRDRAQFLIWARYNALEHYNMTQALARLPQPQQQASQ
jgi:hypothetical protein